MNVYPIEFSLAKVFTFREKGSGNISWTVQPRADDGQPCRFVPIWFKAHFPSSASVESTQNEFKFAIDHWAGEIFDTTMYADLNVGVTQLGQRDLFWRWPVEEWASWIIESRSALKISWTNPETGVQTWGCEVAILRLD